jgi:hypothetical protein
MVDHRPGESSGWIMLVLGASFALLNAARGARHARNDFDASRSVPDGVSSRVGRVVGGAILALFGIAFCAMGIPLLREETTVAIAVCLAPGAAMLFIGARLTLGRRRPDGTYAHPVVRDGAGAVFAGIGVLVLAGTLALKGLSAPFDLVYGASLVALGVAFTRGRLGS